MFFHFSISLHIPMGQRGTHVFKCTEPVILLVCLHSGDFYDLSVATGIGFTSKQTTSSDIIIVLNQV